MSDQTSPEPRDITDRGDYTAEGQHADAPVDDLERLLDEYDRQRRRPTTDDGHVRLEPEVQFRLDWVSQRESVVRAALEEVVWRLDRRGHTAWVDLVGRDVDGGRTELASIALYVLPDHADSETEPARMLFRPEPERFQVAVEPPWAATDTLDPDRGNERMIGELDELAVVTMATRLAQRALFDD